MSLLTDMVDFTELVTCTLNSLNCLCSYLLPQEEDRFTRTDCYHYFHVDCFARYIHHMEQVDDSVDGIPGQPVTSGAESNV